MKILAVEDDQAVAQSLKLLFSSYNYAVDIAADGEAGLQMSHAFAYDLVLLDVELPKLDGVSLCRQLRTEGVQSPILLLTGQGEGRQKAIALNAGADDYVVKPFDTAELMARVQALLRRGNQTTPAVLAWGELCVDPSHSTVIYGQHLLAVTPKEYAILELLLRHPQKVFSASAILNRAWESAEAPGEETVRVHIKDIRQKLKAAGAPQDLIKTVYQMGYRLNPLYSSALAQQVEHQPTQPLIAELTAVNQELRTALKQLQTTEAERHQALASADQTIRQLELQVAECQANSAQVNLILQKKAADRQQTDLELQDMSNALSLAVEGISRLDQQGRYVFVNEAYARMVGYKAAEMIGMDWSATVHPGDLDLAIAAYQQMLSQGQVELELTGLRKDGSLFDKQLFMATAYDDQQQFSGHYCFMKDITQRKLAAAALQRQLEREHLVAEITRSIHQTLELEPILQHAVDQIRQILQTDRVLILRFRTDWQGIVVAESVGADWTSILANKIHDPCFSDHYVESYRQGRVSMIVDLENSDITPCHAEFLAGFQVKANLVIPILQSNRDHHQLWGLLVSHHCTSPRQWQVEEIELLKHLANQLGIAIQKSELYAQTCRELRERQQAEQQIREQAALLDIASDAIFVRDLDHRILYWNQGAEHLYGWTATEAIGQKATELLQDDLAQLSTMMQTLFEQGEWRGELHKVTKAQKPVIVEGRWTLVRDEANQPKCILAVNTDITEKKQLEAQFYQAQRMESLGTLASGIAHDLNNVLTPILAIVQLMRLTVQPLNTTPQEMLGIIEESAKRGASMVKQILTFARGTATQPTKVQIAPLLQEVATMIRQTFPKPIHINLEIPEQPLEPVSADSTHLHQVFMNLCVNARDAMPNGGVLTLSAEPCDVDQSFAQSALNAKVGRYVLLTFADTGIGIPAELQDRIFDPFFTTKAVGQGTGLGLSTALGIIKNYGGFLQVFSQVGQGTQMKVYLPVADGAAIEQSTAAGLSHGSGELLLLVDDDLAVQQTNQALLERYHYKTCLAYDGIEAIDIYTKRQNEIEAILIDVMMPNMNGIEAIRALRRISSQVKIIAVSGLPSNQAATLAAGATLFLPKPYSLEQLLTSLEVLIKG
jgi:two-component system, cell cycle sensor histidine kinase and response regulator CckA